MALSVATEPETMTTGGSFTAPTVTRVEADVTCVGMDFVSVAVRVTVSWPDTMEFPSIEGVYDREARIALASATEARKETDFSKVSEEPAEYSTSTTAPELTLTVPCAAESDIVMASIEAKSSELTDAPMTTAESSAVETAAGNVIAGA